MLIVDNVMSDIHFPTISPIVGLMIVDITFALAGNFDLS
jgi:hypothetical protein